jgi:hypothetical protein
MHGHTDPFDLNEPGTYPTALRSFLDENLDAYVQWFTDGPRRSATAYDDVSRRLAGVLRGYRVRGYHCTRLTLAERDAIQASGMVVSSAGFIERRVQALVDGGMAGEASMHDILRGHVAGESNRAEKIWFTFSPPCVHGEHGVGPFFRRWGGEALHRAHTVGSTVDRLLQVTGTPCIIEAAVPWHAFSRNEWWSDEVPRRFLASKSFDVECGEREGYACIDLAADCVLALHTPPAASFWELSGARNWWDPLT